MTSFMTSMRSLVSPLWLTAMSRSPSARARAYWPRNSPGSIGHQRGARELVEEERRPPWRRGTSCRSRRRRAARRPRRPTRTPRRTASTAARNSSTSSRSSRASSRRTASRSSGLLRREQEVGEQPGLGGDQALGQALRRGVDPVAGHLVRNRGEQSGDRRRVHQVRGSGREDAASSHLVAEAVDVADELRRRFRQRCVEHRPQDRGAPRSRLGRAARRCGRSAPGR